MSTLGHTSGQLSASPEVNLPSFPLPKRISAWHRAVLDQRVAAAQAMPRVLLFVPNEWGAGQVL